MNAEAGLRPQHFVTTEQRAFGALNSRPAADHRAALVRATLSASVGNRFNYPLSLRIHLEPRAAPLPSLWHITFCPRRVLQSKVEWFDVRFLIAHEHIKIIFCPKRASLLKITLFAIRAVCFSKSTISDIENISTLNHVNVVRHHNPGGQIVPVSRETTKIFSTNCATSDVRDNSHLPYPNTIRLCGFAIISFDEMLPCDRNDSGSCR